MDRNRPRGREAAHPGETHGGGVGHPGPGGYPGETHGGDEDHPGPGGPPGKTHGGDEGHPGPARREDPGKIALRPMLRSRQVPTSRTGPVGHRSWPIGLARERDPKGRTGRLPATGLRPSST